MDSASSSRDCSTAAMIFSSSAVFSAERLRGAIAFASRSKTLMEYQRERVAGARPSIAVAILPRASSTSGVKHLTPSAGVPSWPALIAVFTRVSMFLLRSAETSTTSTPSCLESSAVSMTSPDSLSRSTMLRPRTTGRPASRI